ncbi:MAG: Na/Pi cotransporter family protein [Ruminococcaceae bacterium]|nr:Na/Pi cotransporter family protein [Oscillospiraceae bacterium]
MDFFDVLTLIGGLCLFLFGMSVMGDSLERRAGDKLNEIIGKLTTNKIAGFFTGMVVTALIQSSSATTVMAVGFVNSGLMNLKQAISIIMGANIGTTVTSWILSLGGIEGSNFIVQMFKPMSFTPILALIGIAFFMFGKTNKKKDTGTIFLGFAVLMFGMDIMSGAVAGLRDVPAFRELFVAFKNPILGVIAGAVLTAIIQSSSASVGILQALTVTGQISYGAAFPIIMGQNIGTCITAILSSFGTNRNAKRVALAHLSFNVIGTVVVLIGLYIVKGVFNPAILDVNATHFGIAIGHSIFNILCTIILLPMSSLLEKFVCTLVPDAKREEETTELDERLLQTPAVALVTSRTYALKMANCAVTALKESILSLTDYSEEKAEKIRNMEEQTDHYEDIIGDYLLKLSHHRINEDESAEAAKLLRIIGDFERMSDHAVNILESAEEMRDKKIKFTEFATKELLVISNAVNEIVDLSLSAFENNDFSVAFDIESLEEVIDVLKDELRTSHIRRLQKGQCTIEAGFIWADLLTNFERTSDHCSNIAGCIIETSNHHLNMHEGLRTMKTDNEEFKSKYKIYSEKYLLN